MAWLVSEDNPKGLLSELEELRQELYRLLSSHPEQVNSPKACALSARLDLLITRYMEFERQNKRKANS